MEENKNFQSILDPRPLSARQKILAVVLVFSAIIVFFFGIWQIKRNIQSPFENKVSTKDQPSAGEAEKDNSIVEMQNKDTDEDGLSDYEEFYIYKTSPYLADSDSDGINDKKEIELGNNPNCHEGQDCSIVEPQNQQEDKNKQSASGSNDSTASDKTTTDMFDLDSLNNSSDLNSLSQSDLSSLQNSATDLFSDLSASEIRELLKESGMPSEILDQLTDEQILEAYKTTLENMNKVESPQSP